MNEKQIPVLPTLTTPYIQPKFEVQFFFRNNKLCFLKILNLH